MYNMMLSYGLWVCGYKFSCGLLPLGLEALTPLLLLLRLLTEAKQPSLYFINPHFPVLGSLSLSENDFPNARNQRPQHAQEEPHRKGRAQADIQGPSAMHGIFAQELLYLFKPESP